MSDIEFEKRLAEVFNGMLVRKSRIQNVFGTMNVPSFVRDWFLNKYSNADGSVNVDVLVDKIKTIMPKKEYFPVLVDKMMRGEDVRILARIRVAIDVKTSNTSFALPDYGLDVDDTNIPISVWEKSKEDLLCPDGEVWGVVTLRHEMIPVGKQQIGKICLSGFNAFRPYRVDLNFYRNARSLFSLEEWIDILLAAIDYNPEGYQSKLEKLTTLSRLLPFVEKRINLIELAPKGTGKSYVFSQISKHGWLSSGGVMTRAKMFYDMRKGQSGLVSFYDYVALDEVSTIKFPDMTEMQGALKGYLETGKYTVGNCAGEGDAGIILLGNIRKDQMDTNADMLENINVILRDSALLDRFHGFIKGWDIPRMKENLKMTGLALNTEYFSEIMHAFREDIVMPAVTQALIDVPDNADTRDTHAIEKIATAWMKLLFPHWTTVEAVDKELFDRYCLQPAIEMRRVICAQMAIIDVEYRQKPFPSFGIK